MLITHRFVVNAGCFQLDGLVDGRFEPIELAASVCYRLLAAAPFCYALSSVGTSLPPLPQILPHQTQMPDCRMSC
jgi:hypothetical protein